MRQKKAKEYHDMGYNCAQSVICALGDLTGLDEKTALAVAGGFGGGMRRGEVCGAVSGAVMALGMCFPYNDPADADAKSDIGALAKQFCRLFEQTHGHLACRDLISSARQRQCPLYIEDAVTIAEQMIEERGKGINN